MENYMFMYLKTGGGHFAPAKALAERLQNDHSGTKVHLVDGLAESNSMVKKAVEDGYRNSVNNAMWTYSTIYVLHKLQPVSRLTSQLISYFVKPYLEKRILEIQPSKILVFHFLLIKPVNDIIKKHNLQAKVITVVTDPFTAHPMWFLDAGQEFIVFSQALKNACVNRGIDGGKVHVFPFILDEKYSSKMTEFEKTCAKIELGFDTSKKIILILGGGDGMPRGKDIVSNLVSLDVDAEVAIVCGKNKRLREQCQKLKEKQNLPNLKVYGYVDFVRQLIGISDVVITKCGASTFMEILMMGKIPVINNFIWEQEKGNVEYVCKNGMGVFEKDTRKLPAVLSRLLSDSSVYNSYQENISRAALNNGAQEVTSYLINT